jgi:hypothetical protein
MLKVVHDENEANNTPRRGGSLLDEIARDGARQMLAAALQAEVAAYIERTPTRSTSTVTGWWSATATTSRVR